MTPFTHRPTVNRAKTGNNRHKMGTNRIEYNYIICVKGGRYLP